MRKTYTPKFYEDNARLRAAAFDPECAHVTLKGVRFVVHCHRRVKLYDATRPANRPVRKTASA